MLEIINLEANFLFLPILCSMKIERLLFLKFLKNLAFSDSYFWPFNMSHEETNAIFVISAIMASIWNIFIKFRLHDEKLTEALCFEPFPNATDVIEGSGDSGGDPNEHFVQKYTQIYKVARIFCTNQGKGCYDYLLSKLVPWSLWKHSSEKTSYLWRWPFLLTPILMYVA